MLLHLFVTFIYQPFFNLLLAIYWILQQLPGIQHADMGVAVIIFTIALRFLLLPLTFSGQRSAKERREIEAKVGEIKQANRNDPVEEKREMRELLKSNRRMVISEIFTISIQVAIALMLWRIFAKGLLGEDFHLIYGFMPDVKLPLDLTFLDKYDLTHPSWTLNIIQSLVIFAVEGLSVLTSPYPISKKEAMRMQLVMPIASFIIFAMLPAGKKMFVITTLVFSFILILIQFIRDKFNGLMNPVKPAIVDAIPPEPQPSAS